jgi:hypothetical protein
VAGIRIKTEEKVATFYQIKVAGELDSATNIEFRNLILVYAGADGFSQARQGLAVTTTYHKLDSL